MHTHMHAYIQCEEAHSVLELYRWLGNQFEQAFIDRAKVDEIAQKSLELIDVSTRSMHTYIDTVSVYKAIRTSLRLQIKSGNNCPKKLGTDW